MTYEEVIERVWAGGVLPSGERDEHRVLAMLSGGRDSVCLLDVAVALLGADAVSALHVNYGLRAEADEEERHCRALCERLEVGLEVVRADRSRETRASGAGRFGDASGVIVSPIGPRLGRPVGPGNMQAWAREVRYSEAERIARELDARLKSKRQGGVRRVGERQGNERRGNERQVGMRRVDERKGDKRSGDEWKGDERPGDERPEGAQSGEGDARGETLIATGHTATDQVETILYRLAASPGRRALLGMSPREGRLVRPLLELTREQTAAYCRARGLSWREDSSNDDERYARTRVRNRLLPALDAVHPAARENVLRTARLLREEAEVLDGLVDTELGGGEAGIAIGRLRALPAALRRLVVVRLAEQAAGTYVPQAGARVQEILDLAERGGRAELHVGGLVGAVIEDGWLHMVRLPPRS